MTRIKTYIELLVEQSVTAKSLETRIETVTNELFKINNELKSYKAISQELNDNYQTLKDENEKLKAENKEVWSRLKLTESGYNKPKSSEWWKYNDTNNPKIFEYVFTCVADNAKLETPPVSDSSQLVEVNELLVKKIANTKDIDSDFVEIVNDNFWDII